MVSNRSVAQSVAIHRRQRSRLLILLALALSLLLALSMYQLGLIYLDQVRDAEAKTHNYAAILQARVASGLRHVDAVLQELEHNVAVESAIRSSSYSPPTDAAAKSMTTKLDMHMINAEEVASLWVFDVRGDVRYASTGSNRLRSGIGDRDFFRKMQAHPESGLVFSAVSGSNRRAVLALRAVRDAHGKFLGAVGASIEFDYFLKLFESLDIGVDGFIALRRSDDYTQVVRWPALDADRDSALAMDHPLRMALHEGAAAATRISRLDGDGQKRIASVRRLDRYPFFVIVALGYDEILAAWRGSAAKIGAMGVALLALLIGVLMRMRGYAERVEVFQRLVEHSGQGVGIAKLDSRLNYANPALRRLLGLPQDADSTQYSYERFFKDADRQWFRREVLPSMLESGQWTGELAVVGLQGNATPAMHNIFLIRDAEGAPLAFADIVIDLSERMRAEQALHDAKEMLERRVEERTAELSHALDAAKMADNVKDAFLANVSHELRTPLNAVIGMTGLALSTATDARQRDYLEKVTQAGKTLARIINDLLDLSKISAGRMELETTTFDLRQLLARSSSFMNFKLTEKGLALTQQIDDEVPEVLVGDPLRVEQILLNLLSNAVKFTHTGVVEVHIGLHARKAERVCLSIAVKDTGIGMREEDMAGLFRPFFQTDASMSRKFGGTGLGLTICKRLAEMMDGTIGVSSELGVGTTFVATLWLGLGIAGDLPDAQALGGKMPETIAYTDVRVLVVDDQPYNCEIVQALLAMVGIDARTVDNGQAALDLLAQADPDAFDLILMDIQMPVMDGLTATRELRTRSGFAALPIVAMTAHTMVHENERSLAAGMNDHIGKPFDNKSLYRVLAKWIPKSKQYIRKPKEAVAARGGGLPEMQTVDVQAGLSLHIGDEARYRHWLQDFAAHAELYVDQIDLNLSLGQTHQAGMIAHTIKGRAGLLGIKDVHALAAAVETALDHGDSTDVLLENLHRVLCEVSAEIRLKLGTPSAKASTSMATQGARMAVEEPMPEPIVGVLAMLEAGDADSENALIACIDALKNSAWLAPLQQAWEFVQKFDYAAAHRCLVVASRLPD